MLGSAGGAVPIAFMLMSIGIIMMIPKISESIDSFLAGKGIAGTAIGEALGPFGSLAKTAGGYAQQIGANAVGSRLLNRLEKSGKEDAGAWAYVADALRAMLRKDKPKKGEDIVGPGE